MKKQLFILLFIITILSCRRETITEYEWNKPLASVVDSSNYNHIFTVWFENKPASSVYGSSSAPYINQLKAQGVSFSSLTAWGHPSYPNYIALFSGSNQGVTSDACISGTPFSTANLYTSLHSAGKSFAWYSEGLPSQGSTICSSGDYREKHNPTTIFSKVPTTANKPFSAVNWQTVDYNTLENCVMISPNQKNDMHDTPVSYGDAWLKNTLSRLVDWCKNPANRSLFVVYFDEGLGTNNKIPVVMIGSNTKVKYTITTAVNHYSFTKMIVSNFGGSVINSNVSNATDIKGYKTN